MSSSLQQVQRSLNTQMQTVQSLRQQLNGINGQANNNKNIPSVRDIIKQQLLDIRGDIEDLHNREIELENNNILMRHSVFKLKNEIEDLSSKLRTASSSMATAAAPTKTTTNVAPIATSTHVSSAVPASSAAFPVVSSIFNHDNWRFESLKSCMADSQQMQQISDTLEIHSLPEMVFASSHLKLSCPTLEISFEAINGLRPCLGEPLAHKQVQVQYAKEWKSKSKQGKDVQTLHFAYDWTFTTDYKGDYAVLKPLAKAPCELDNGMAVEKNVSDRFNMALLTDTTAPILWSCYSILFEDELSDNGMSQLFVRCRVMPRCFLVLLRFWMRVDNVIIRVHDTRIYHEFDSKFMLRHYEERETKWERLLKKYGGKGNGATQVQFTDPNHFADKIDVVSSVYDKIYIA